MMKKVALIEFSSSHTECLYSQILFLQEAGYHITLICDKKMAQVVQDFGKEISCLFFDFGKLISLLRVRSFILQQNMETVILNTAQGSIPLKFLSLYFPRRIRFYGTIHNVHKIETSLGQKIISRKVRSYYVLSKYQFLQIPEYRNLSFAYFNPSFFPTYESHQKNLAEKGDEMWVVIPGALEYKRRDYHFLIDFLKRYPQENLKFILLGNGSKGDGEHVINTIKEHQLERFFTYFDGFVPNSLFQFYVQNADYLLPLIHPEAEGAENYTKYKISGIFPLSLAYDVPLLCHDIFEGIEGFEYPALFYADSDGLWNIFRQKLTVRHSLPLCFDNEKNRYIQLLETKRD